MPKVDPVSRDHALGAEVTWFRFRREILASIIILILLAAGWGVYKFYADRQESSAATALAAAHDAGDYERVIQQYGNTAAGASAALLLAEAQRKDKKFLESNATLQLFIDKHPEHELVPTAKIAMAGNLESMGKIDEALTLNKQTAANYAKTFAAPLALLSEVALLKARNQTEEARRVCETVLTQYSDSYWAGEAMRELRALKPPANAHAPGAPGANPGIPAALARPPAMPPPGAVPAAPPAASAPPKPK
jgi:predicted negative regulator of RcsB-dependent stress response